LPVTGTPDTFSGPTTVVQQGVPNPSNPGTANGRWQFNPVVVTTQSGGAVAWHFNTPLDGAAMSAPTASGSTAQYLSNSPATAVLGGVGPQTLINALPADLRPGSTPFYYDPQAENQRLDQAALAQTGRTSFINGLTYDSQNHLTVDDQQKLILYQNAVDYAKAHNVQLGQALTPEQLAALDKPMLWYVTQQVPDPNCLSGACPMVSALVPQVYLPQGYSGIGPGGSIVASKSLELLADSPIRNTGTLGSYGTLTSNTTIINEQRAAEMTAAWQPIEDGWARTTGQQGQANSGFVFAANAAGIAGQIQNINGVVAQLNADGTMSAAEAARVAAAVQAGMQVVTSTHTDTFVRSPDVMGEIFAGVVIAAIAVMTGGALGPALSGLASGTFGATVTGGAVGSMTGSAIGQFAANDGINFGKLFTAGAVGALTAGIANGVTVGADGSLGTAMDWSQKVADNSLAGVAGAQSVSGTTMTQAAASTTSNLLQRAEAVLIMSAANAGVNTIAYGGSFGRSFLDGLVVNSAAIGAYSIGDALPGLGATGATPGSVVANVAAHGLLGCAAASLSGGDCAGGAAGAMSSAIVAPILRDAQYGASGMQTAFPNTNGTVTNAYLNPVFNMVTEALATLAGGAMAKALGGTAAVGAAAAQNEALNNSDKSHVHSPAEESHEELRQLLDRERVMLTGGSGIIHNPDGTETIKPPPIVGVGNPSNSKGWWSGIGGNVRLYSDGSLRTADGKFASVSGAPAPGTTAATQFAGFLSSNGVNVVGQEVVVYGPLGPRRYDIVTQDANGLLHGIEIKSGSATPTLYQRFTDMFVNSFGASGAGRFSGRTINSATTVYVP
ncbi:DUF637 domain-containing protein, partial [Ralstonia nicotianae]